jgi:hypothetical protein
MLKKLSSLLLAALLTMSLAGCKSNSSAPNAVTGGGTNESNTVTSSSNDKSNAESTVIARGELPDLEVHFGDKSKTLILQLDDNDTSAELARNIGEAGMNLPIYHFDDFENYKVMQYYDIPSRFSIPSNPEEVTSEKAGEVFYSAPNRVILFYQDAEIKGRYTRVGHLVDTVGLKETVENNPVVEGWGNKVISINYIK